MPTNPPVILRVRNETNDGWYEVTGGAHPLLGETHSDAVTTPPTQGDLIVANSAPQWARLAKGADNKVLRMVSGAPAWSDGAYPVQVTATANWTTDNAGAAQFCTDALNALNFSYSSNEHVVVYAYYNYKYIAARFLTNPSTATWIHNYGSTIATGQVAQVTAAQHLSLFAPVTVVNDWATAANAWYDISGQTLLVYTPPSGQIVQVTLVSRGYSSYALLRIVGGSGTTSWVTTFSSTPGVGETVWVGATTIQAIGGSDKNVQYNDNGVLGGVTNNSTATSKYLRQVSSGTPSFELVTAIADTRANILAMTATAGLSAYATDTYEFLVGDGTNWRKDPFALVTEPVAPDMGYTQESSKIGYGTTYVTDKSLNNVTLGSNTSTSERGIWANEDGAFIYLNGTAQKFVTGFRFRETDSGYVLEHQPLEDGEWIAVFTGNSESVGLNGIPLVQGYKTSMGAYPPKTIMDGGSF